MPCTLDRVDFRAEFFRHEASLSEIMANTPQATLCLYGLRSRGAMILMDALRTHPIVIVDIPYYTEPSEFLSRTWPRRTPG